MLERVPTGRGEALSADAFEALVRAHADRAYDRVRRSGAPRATALRAVEASALDLLAPAREGVAEPVLVGRWFATAAALGGSAEGSRPGPQDPSTPDEDGPPSDLSVLVAAALARRPGVERTALLLGDVYDLPAPVLAAALATSPDEALRTLGRARAGLLPDVFQGDPPGTRPCDEIAVARLAGGDDGAVHSVAGRHVTACARCSEVLRAEEDVRGLLAQLPVVPLPEPDRELLLERIGGRARAALPARAPAVPVAAVAARPDLLRPAPALLALLLAALVGLAGGMLLSDPAPVPAAAQRSLPPVVAPAPLTPSAPPPTTGPPAAPPVPTTTVFTYPPVPTLAATVVPPSSPSPSAPPVSPTPPATPTPSVTLTPRTGLAGAALRVAGTGWQPGVAVRLLLLRPDGTRTSASTHAVPDASGAFAAVLTGWSDQAPAGTYRVSADQGDVTATTAYTVAASGADQVGSTPGPSPTGGQA